MTPDPQEAGGRASRRAISDAVAVQLVGRTLGMVASVTTVALTTRSLGVEGYGLLTTAVVFAGLWSSLTELGVGAVIVRRVSAGAGRLDQLVAVSIGLSLAYCLPLGLLATAVGLGVYHDQPRVHGALAVVCLGLALTTVTNCFGPVFMTRMRFGAVALADLLARLASLAATVIVVLDDGGPIWFAAVQLVPTAVQLAVLWAAASRLDRLRASFDRGAALALLRESLPQTGVLVVAALYWRADAVILTLLGSVSEVGAYGLAYTISFTLSVVSSFYLASSLSTMTALHARDRPGFARFVESGVEAMAFLAVPLAVLGGLLARPVVVLLGSDAFAASATVPLVVLLVAVGLTFVNGVLGQALFAAHDQRFLLRLNLVNLAVNIALNLLLVPPYGAEGCAIALLVSEISGLVATTWRLAVRSGYRPPWPFVARLVPPTAVGAVVAVLLGNGPTLVALAGTAAAYVVANLALGPVRLDTVRHLRSTRTEPAT